jgi:hypothetical protein
VAYAPKWESLASALERVTEAGETEERAKVDICNVVADREINVRVYPPDREKSYSGGNVYVPRHLNPANFDWSQSRPLQQWVVGPMLGQHYVWNPERLPIDFIELCTADVERVLISPLVAKAEQRRRAEVDAREKRGKRPRIKEYLAKHYPQGGPAHAQRKRLKNDLLKWDQSLQPLDDQTLKTAIDEHNASIKQNLS